MLTIAIPTYNRNKEVVDTILSTLPQLNENCKLLIIDNASSISVSDSLIERGVNLKDYNYTKLIQNVTNVGAQANLLRCIELCDTEWLWILGDDDLPNTDAVNLILKDLKSHEGFTFFNYCSLAHTRKDEIISSGITEFLNAFEDWGQINFTSLCILNAKQIKPYLRFGFLYAYSWSCINACLFSCIVDKGGKALFSKKVILSEIDRASDDNKWIPLGPHFGKNILLELLPNNSDKKLLASKMNNKPALEYIICLLIDLIISSGNKKHYIYIYNNMIYRLYYFNNNMFAKIKFSFYRLLLHNPKISSKLVNYLLKKSGRVVTVNINQFNRT
ncbi:MAG: glycosyltransferase family 2 protein [Bacteroidota bacterium]